jgi:hypothetical protein
MLDSRVFHTLQRTEALDITQLFPRVLHRLRPPGRACKNNLVQGQTVEIVVNDSALSDTTPLVAVLYVLT